VRGAFFSGWRPASIGPVRTLLLMALVALLAGCIHLPPEVAAVVEQADPPGRNHFRPDPPAERAADNAGPRPR